MGNVKLLRVWQNAYTGEYTIQQKVKNHREEWDPTNLVVDEETLIVFYKFTEVVLIPSGGDTKVGYMCPYLSANAKNCQLIDGKIVEIG